MNRRRFLELTSRTLLGTVFAGSLVSPPQANAIAPVVVFAIIQTAISLAQLFSQGGGGVGTLLRLQVEMLKAISQKLDVIQAGIL